MKLKLKTVRWQSWKWVFETMFKSTRFESSFKIFFGDQELILPNFGYLHFPICAVKLECFNILTKCIYFEMVKLNSKNRSFIRLWRKQVWYDQLQIRNDKVWSNTVRKYRFQLFLKELIKCEISNFVTLNLSPPISNFVILSLLPIQTKMQ